MKWHIVATVFAKELKETLRDRRTMAIMILVPVFLYPALFVIAEQLALFGQRSLEESAVRVAVIGTAPA
jgi:sodium transport system permease protein